MLGSRDGELILGPSSGRTALVARLSSGVNLSLCHWSRMKQERSSPLMLQPELSGGVWRVKVSARRPMPRLWCS